MIKRFAIVENSKNYLRVDDKTKQKFYLNEKEVIDLLNYLSEENEQLKEENKRLRVRNNIYDGLMEVFKDE